MEPKKVYKKGCIIKYIAHKFKTYCYGQIIAVRKQTYLVTNLYFKRNAYTSIESELIDDINKHGFEIEMGTKERVVKIGNEICEIIGRDHLLHEFQNNELFEDGAFLFLVKIKE